MLRAVLPLLLLTFLPGFASAQPSAEQLAKWLKRFPDADANGDGRLTATEAAAYRDKVLQRARPRTGAPRTFRVDPGWEAERFPDHAVSHKSPKEIRDLYASRLNGRGEPVVSFPRPADGSLRIVGTGHSFMAPGYKTLPAIVRTAGLKQPPMLLHTGGGITGSTRYKWEQENGIFQFDGKPQPKLLASIANARWDAMTWGPYYRDRPAYYTCWIDFCLKYNPEMKFYLSDAWPQLDQLDELPESEAAFTPEVIARLGREKNEQYGTLIDTLRKAYPGKVFIMPTSDAMVLAAELRAKGELPGVEGVHAFLGKKERSLWRDRLGHLGPGFGQLEGYVFYATLYGRSPELLDGDPFGADAKYPSVELDRVFRRIAWRAVTGNRFSGVKDANENGIADDRE